MIPRELRTVQGQDVTGGDRGIHIHDRHNTHTHTHTFMCMYTDRRPLCIGRLAVSPHRGPTAHIQARKWVFHIQETSIASEESFCGLSPVGLERKWPAFADWKQRSLKLEYTA